MLGEEVADPLGVEGPPTREAGLQCLPLRTELAARKTSRRVEVQWRVGGHSGLFHGYEIHMGHSLPRGESTPRFLVRSTTAEEWQTDGMVGTDGRTWGTYVHGLFASGAFVQEWLTQVGATRRRAVHVRWQDWQTQRAVQFDRLADVLAEHLDMGRIVSLLG
jgi:adenosylcobyric acid synthase